MAIASTPVPQPASSRRHPSFTPARRALVQAAYQWQMTDASASDIIAQFAEGEALKKADVEFFSESLRRLMAQTEALDAHIEPLLDRKLSEMSVLTELFLYMASRSQLVHQIKIMAAFFD